MLSTYNTKRSVGTPTAVQSNCVQAIIDLRLLRINRPLGMGSTTRVMAASISHGEISKYGNRVRRVATARTDGTRCDGWKKKKTRDFRGNRPLDGKHCGHSGLIAVCPGDTTVGLRDAFARTRSFQNSRFSLYPYDPSEFIFGRFPRSRALRRASSSHAICLT